MPPPPVPPRPPSLDHFAIFNPSKRKDGRHTAQNAVAGPSKPSTALSGNAARDGQTGERDADTDQPDHTPTSGPQEQDAVRSARDIDLEDDLREASQILFYTSRYGSVSRDTMLRQVGLVRGLMGFTEMVAPDKEPGDYWSFRSHRGRMIVYSPAPEIYIYANITLAMVSPVLPEPRTTRLKPTQDPKGKAPASAKGEPAPTAQGLSDEMLVQGLQRGFQEFQLIHGPFSGLVDSPSSSTILEKFWTTFTYDYESTYLSPLSPLEISSGGVRAFTGTTSKRVQGALRELPIDDTMDNIGVISTTGSASLYPVDQALVGWLSKTLTSSLPPKPDSQPGQASPKVDEGRKSSWSTLGLSWVPSISSRSVTPSKLAPSFTLTGSGSGTSDGGIKPMLKARPSKQSMGGHSRGPSAGSLDSPGTPRLGTQLSPLNSSPAATGGSRDTVSKDDKWGFGLGGLTDAMGSLKAPGIDVANLFRFGTPPTPSTPDPDKLGDNPNDAEATNGDAHLSGAMSQTGGANEATVSLNDPPLSDPTTDPPISSPAADPPAANSADQKGDVRSSLEVEPRPGLLPELEAASTHVIDLGWISRVVYLRPNAAQEARTEEMAGEEPSEPSDSDAPTDGAAPDSDSPDRSPVLRELQKFTVSWIIRDTILLYLVSSTNTSLSSASSSKANPPTESVLELYAKLSSIFSLPTINTRSSSDHTRDTTTWVYSSSSMNIPSSSPMPRSSQDTLVSLKDWAAEDRAVDEVFGKTSSDFVALKRVDGSAPADGKPDRGFVALSLGRKDASLTDTDYAMRGFLRSHPDLG